MPKVQVWGVELDASRFIIWKHKQTYDTDRGQAQNTQITDLITEAQYETISESPGLFFLNDTTRKPTRFRWVLNISSELEEQVDTRYVGTFGFTSIVLDMKNGVEEFDTPLALTIVPADTVNIQVIWNEVPYLIEFVSGVASLPINNKKPGRYNLKTYGDLRIDVRCEVTINSDKIRPSPHF